MYVQIITVNDDIAPTGTAPADVVVFCPSDVPAPDITTVTNVSDNCSVPVVAFVNDVSDGNVCNGEVITRTYSITDECGNSIFVSHTITILVVTPSANLSYTNPTTCGGQDGTITFVNLTPNTSYEFTYNGNMSSYQSNGSGQIVLNGLSEGTYSGFMVVSSDCVACPQTLPNQIVLNDPTPPIVNAGQDITVCYGDNVTLTAQNPDYAQITWSGGVQNGIAFMPPVGTNVYVVTAILNNCVSTDEVAVTVNPLPNVNAGSDQNCL